MSGESRDVDPGPVARLEVVKADGSAPGVIFQRLTERESLKEIAKSWRVPKGRFTEWFTTQHADLYDAALKVVAADLALEALDISDEQAEVVKESGEAFDPNVQRDKLRVDTRLKLASKFDRLRYGETVRVEKSVTMAIDAGLLGTAGALLQLASVHRLPERIVAGAEELEPGSAPAPQIPRPQSHELI